MNKEKLIALGLSEEQATKVLEGFKGYIPPERFNEVNEAKKNAEALVAERDKQLAEIKKNAGNNEELKAQIETLQKENKAAKEKFESDLKALKIENAINAALTANGAKNLKAARALLDLEKITLDGDEVKGIGDQIKALLADDGSKFLFDVKPAEIKPAGTKAAEGGNPANKPVSEMNYSERVAYLAAGGTLE